MFGLMGLCPGPWRMLSIILCLQPLGASSTPQIMPSKMSLDMASAPLGADLPLSENCLTGSLADGTQRE